MQEQKWLSGPSDLLGRCHVRAHAAELDGEMTLPGTQLQDALPLESCSLIALEPVEKNK